MLGALFCFLFGYVAAQEYFLGDPITVEVDGKMFDPKGTLIDANVTKFWMRFPGNSGANTIDFAPITVTTVRENTLTRISLTCNFGTEQKVKALPTYVVGKKMEIFGEAIVFERATKKYKGTFTANVRNVTFGRRITTVLSQGVVATWSTLQKSVDVVLANFTGTPRTSEVVVQLVSISNSDLILYDSMNVTKVTPISGVPTFFKVDGVWNQNGKVPMTDLKLLVGLKTMNQPFNTYAIANNAMSDMFSYIIVDSATFKVTAPATIPEYNVTNITVMGGGVSSFWWLLATDKVTNAQYMLNCQSQMDSDFQNFEWYVQPINKKTYPYLPMGQYDLAVVYTKTATRDANASVKYPTSDPVATMEVTGHAPMALTPISFNRNSGQQLGYVRQGQQVSVEVYSVFSKIKLQWFKLSPNSNYTNSSNGNDTTGWEAIVGTDTSFTMTPGQTQKLTMTVPNGFNLTFSAKVRLYGWTEDCDMNHFGQVFVRGNITSAAPAPSPSSSSTLGPGAIVGIVCAVVFVCGVAAWWLCMKKPGNQDRYQKLEK